MNGADMRIEQTDDLQVYENGGVMPISVAFGYWHHKSLSLFC